ncbi:MAG: hypothetical protein KAU90_08125 [Sulfurovaceae bacterium]|nr:hypothetical protein [Sulfurovaceae bacterium]
MSRNIILLSIIFIINGCGMMGGNSKKDTTLATTLDMDSNRTYEVNSINDINSTDESNNSTDIVFPTITIAKSDILPQTISMDFPEILVDTKEENNQIDETNSTVESSNSETNDTDENESIPTTVTNIGYNQLKNSISKIKNIVTIAQVNLILLKKVMPQVLDKCDGMISCVFEPEYLSIVLDNETISQIDEITKDSNFTLKMDNNVTNKLLLGKVSFAKYDDYNRSYNYELTLDMASDNIDLVYNKIENNITDDNIIDDNITNISKSDINITEYQNFKWSDDNLNVTTRYFYQDSNTTTDISIFYINEDGKETMHVYNSSENEKHKENMNLTLADKEDDNSTVVLQSNTIEQFTDGNDSNISSFSTNGEISDESSTLLFAGSISDNNTTSEVNCDNNSSCDENNSRDINNHLELHELNISDGNLTDGSYILLPPYIDIKGLKLIDIFRLTLGTFTVFEDKAQGEIHNNSYNDMINKLTIVKMNESQNSTNMFKIIPQKDRPTLKIVDD